MQRVSVALCTFNGGRFVAEQLRSILAQGDVVGEVIVADDGSSDDTVARVRAVADQAIVDGSRTEFRFLAGGGFGVAANFARALAACRFDLIALADQDDVWRADKVARMVGEFDRRPGLLLLHTDARLVDADGLPTGRFLLGTLELAAVDAAAIHGGEAFTVLLRRNLATGATSMIRRELLASALPFPPAWVHDEWLAMIGSAIGDVDFIPDPLVDYRQHGGNQIGVRVPTLGVKLRRALEDRGSRNRALDLRAGNLVERLHLLGPKVAESKTSAAEGKAAFEALRAQLPTSRIRRVAPIIRAAQGKAYSRFASQGKLDIVRDLLQPASQKETP